MRIQFLISLTGFGLMACVTHGHADEVTVYPPEINLSGARDFQSVTVFQVADNGRTSDLTESAQMSIANTQIAKIEEGRIIPVGDGETLLIVETDSKRIETTVHVANATADDTLSFRLDVMPVLTKTGCNSGRCHGAARGKDGFQLSLYGFDASGDYYRIARELPGRRINLARPTASLLLTKGTGQAPHTGGQRFTADSEYFHTLERWLHEGARDDPPSIAQAISIHVYPPEAVLAGPKQTQQLVVVADYSDGTTRDVTRLATFISNNDNSAEVSASGVIKSQQRGEAFVMARFDSFTEGIPVIALPAEANIPLPTDDANNYIDELIARKLRKLLVQSSELCTDERFVRRVYIDLIGLTPNESEYQQFVSSTDPDKRSKLIDALLQREEFVDLWAMKLGEMLKIRTANQVSYKALLGFHKWVRHQIANDMPLNELLAEVIRAEGGTFNSPATNFYQIEANNRLLSENVAQSFLGIRIQCAQCHNHPFDRWTMDDYYGFSAFFSRIGFKQSTDPREYIVHELNYGETHHVVDNRVVQPKYLGGVSPNTEGKKRRAVLAEWISDSKNPYVATNLANIVWAHHMGRGIVEPVDDVRISNPPANEPLLNQLAARFRNQNFNLKELVRDVCESKAYQRSTRTNETNADDLTNFSHSAVRRIRAEVLLDSITRITNTSDRFARLPADARSVEIADGAVSNYFLSTFGRANRETVCSCEVDVVPTLSQAFHLINGETTNQKIEEGGVVSSMLEEGLTAAEIIERLYVRCYSRKPMPDEINRIVHSFASNDLESELNDVFWALLNSKEFIFNH